MTRKLLFVAFLLTITLTAIAANHQLTNAAPDMAPPPQHAPSIASATTAVTPTWQVIAGGSGKDAYLTDVSLSSSTDGWAVGVTGPASYGVLMHYDGATWSQTSIPTGTYNINAVTMISPTEGWAVGLNACISPPCDIGLLMHYTQTGWQRASLPPAPGGGHWSGGFSGIDIKGNAGWIVGDPHYFLQFTGSSWTPITAPIGASAVSMVDANETWAAGEYNYMTNALNFAHYSGGAWTLVTPTLTLPPNYYPYIRSIYMLNASEGWAVGTARYSSALIQCLIMHYTGGTWLQTSCPSADVVLNAVAMRSSSDIWAVGQQGGAWRSGNGVIYHYNGSTWITATVPSDTPSLSSVELVGADDGWIVGSGGTILRLVNGTWTRVQGSNLYVGPISAVSPNEVWYGGPTGQLYRWQSGDVTQYSGPLTTPIKLLEMVNSQVGWGYTWQPYRIFRYANGTWTAWSSSPFLSMDMVGPDEGWFGEFSSVLHYSSGTWQWQSMPNSYGASSLSMLDSNHGWAVSSPYFHPTYANTVITYTNGTWAAVTPTLTLPGVNHALKVIGISPSEAWVAGWSLNIMPGELPISAELDHYFGGAWTSIPMPDWRAFLDISKVSATEWWAAGKLTTGQYAFLHYNNGTYTVVPAAGEDVQQVSMLSDGTGFARGVGSLLRLNSYPYHVYLPLIRR